MISMPSDEVLARAMESNAVATWEPHDKPHCSDCRYARVFGEPGKVEVRCAMGEGKDSMPLFKLIRPHRPMQFRPAANCPTFDSMGG